MRASDASVVRPRAYRGQPYIGVVIVLVVAALARHGFVDSRTGGHLANLWAYYSLLTVGFYYVFGLSGQFAFSQAAFAGVGAYASAWATRSNGFGVGVLVAAIAAAVIALAFSLLVRRASHFYFAIATLGLGEVVLLVARNWEGLTDSIGGESLIQRRISIFGHALINDEHIFRFLLGVLGLTMVLGYALLRSPVGREAVAFRDQPVVAATLGVPVGRVRHSTFVLGSVVAAVGGAVFAHWNGFATPDSFGVDLGLAVFLMLILGGSSSLWGALLGAAFYVYAPELITPLREYTELFYGALLMIVMIVLPDGLIGLARRVPLPRQRAAARSATKRVPPPASSVGSPTSEPLVTAAEIHVSFGGVRAVDGVSLTLHRDEILGLVGPNGSGKSTFLNAITGVVPADGRVEVARVPVRLGRAGAARRAGIARAYQTPQIYRQLTCLEDVLLSTADRAHTGMLAAWFARPLMLARERRRWGTAVAALERAGLAPRADHPAGDLAYGEQRRLEVARALAAQPKAILLDEPSAGLNAIETAELSRLLAGLRSDGIALLVVDHKIDFITGLCDRVAVLEQGRLVAEGPADTIWSDQRVVDAYLGVVEVEVP